MHFRPKTLNFWHGLGFEFWILKSSSETEKGRRKKKKPTAKFVCWWKKKAKTCFCLKRFNLSMILEPKTQINDGVQSLSVLGENSSFWAVRVNFILFFFNHFMALGHDFRTQNSNSKWCPKFDHFRRKHVFSFFFFFARKAWISYQFYFFLDHFATLRNNLNHKPKSRTVHVVRAFRVRTHFLIFFALNLNLALVLLFSTISRHWDMISKPKMLKFCQFFFSSRPFHAFRT